MPLQSVGQSFEPGAVDAILNDLADSYRRTQENRFSAIHLTLSPKDDPFIELPALQVVADRLWVTKDSVNRPFTLGHYRSLAALRSDTASPASVVLDDYLGDLLNKADSAGDLTPDQWLELRLDCLYLLTDRVGHRRALTETLLLEELRQIRSQALNHPETTEARLKTALAPLHRARLIRQDMSRSGERQYELAHDFAVRSVVAKWRQLDRNRAATLAVLEEEKKRSQIKISGLEGFDRRVTQFLLLAPLVSFVAFVVVGQTFNAYDSWEDLPRLPLRFSLITVPFLVVLLVAVLRRHQSAAALGAVGAIWSASLPVLGGSRALEGHASLSLLVTTVVPLYL